MTYRFMLEVPEELGQETANMIESVPDAEALTVRRPDAATPMGQQLEITVVAQSFAVIDRIYEWVDSLDPAVNVHLDLFGGDRYSLRAYDSDSLQRAISAHQPVVEEATPAAPRTRARGSNLIAEIPFGGNMTDVTTLAPAARNVELGSLDHIGLKVRDIARAERFYQTFFGMEIVYRAYREEDHWVQLDEPFDWSESIHTGIAPEVVRMANGPIVLSLVDVGAGRTLFENRVDHLSLRVPRATFNLLRGEALFHSFTVHEDIINAFRFVDPFGVVWQLIAEEEQ